MAKRSADSKLPIPPERSSKRSRTATTNGSCSITVSAGDVPVVSDTIVVGIDFGTSTSGSAWGTMSTLANKPYSGTVVKDWPNNEYGEEIFKKCQTVVALTGNQVLCGNQVLESHGPLRLLKLLLAAQHGQDLVHTILKTATDRVNQTLVDDGKDAFGAVVLFLEHILLHTKKQIIRKLGGSTSLQGMVWHFIITVPANWEDGPSLATRRAAYEAAVKAGMKGTVDVVNEPHAGLLYALHDYPRAPPQIDETYIVCDAGGGTVDMTAYQILSLEPLRLQEVTTGRAALCGITRVDKKFQEYLEATLTPEAFRRLRNNPRSWQGAMLQWDKKIKTKIAGDSKDPAVYALKLDGLQYGDAPRMSPNNDLLIPLMAVKDMFEETIRSIITLVQTQLDQLTEDPRGIILIGGYGSSEYLRQRLDAQFGPSSNRVPISTTNPLVTHSRKAQTAVARGAVAHAAFALNGRDAVVSRRARRWYGTDCHPVFDLKVHKTADKYIDCAGEARAKDQMNWFIKPGDRVMSGVPIRSPFVYQSKERGARQTVELYVSDAANAPKKFSIGDPNIRPFVKLEVDIPAKFWRKPEEEGGMWTVKFMLGVLIESGRIAFDCVPGTNQSNAPISIAYESFF